MFDPPQPPNGLRIVSRAVAPAKIGLVRDPRVLGLGVRQVRLWKGGHLRVLDALDESLADGFHPFEPDNGIRWTDGNAAIPVSLFAGIAGPCQLEVLVGGSMKYPLVAEAVGPAAA